MDFPTQYTKDNSKIFTEAGQPYLEEYTYKLDKSGHKILVKSGEKTDVYARIQADRDSCDINILMQRFINGDSSAIEINKGAYIDTRDLPKNMFEVYEKGLEAEQYFDSLPVELREMFDNSATVFFTEIGEKSFDEKVSQYNDRFMNHKFDDPNAQPDPKPAPSEVTYNE